MHPQPAEYKALMSGFITIIIYKNLQLACDRGSAGLVGSAMTRVATDAFVRPAMAKPSGTSTEQVEGSEKETRLRTLKK